MHSNQDPSARKRRLISPKSNPMAVDPIIDEETDEDALWEALPDTIPLDPKIVELAETLFNEEFLED